MKISLTFEVVRDTKNTIVYGEMQNGKVIEPRDPNAVIGQLYIQKRVIGTAASCPKRISVEIMNATIPEGV